MSTKIDSSRTPVPQTSSTSSTSGSQPTAPKIGNTIKAAGTDLLPGTSGRSDFEARAPKQPKIVKGGSEDGKTEDKIQAKTQELLDAKPGEDHGTRGGVIDVHFHVINSGKGIANGDVPQEQIEKQIQVLNDAYKNTGWSFRLSSTDRTTNKVWYTAAPDTAAERQMKKSLHQGGANELNLYSSNPGGGLLGWATFPADYKTTPKQDGVVMLFSALPGGSSAPYNEGDTATHEVGHWMGLFHTWHEERIQGRGAEDDGIKDTNEHAEPNFGKPAETTDTLPDKPGFDPVHNYMNYVDDDWMNEFTKGQDARMDANWQLFREGGGAKH